MSSRPSGGPSTGMWLRALSLACASMVILLTSRAHASPLFELLGGFGGQGALQARHEGPSAASTYFNPALLVDAPVGLSGGFLLVRQQIGVRLDGRNPSANVPDGVSNAAHTGDVRLSGYPIATTILQNGRVGDAQMSALAARPRQGAGTGASTNTYEAVGLIAKMLHEKLAFGFYGLIPNKTFSDFRSYYVDEREQYFSNSLHPELYGDRLKAISMAFAAGAQLTRDFSIGLGATVGLHAAADAHAYVADASRLNELQLDIQSSAKVLLSPHLGVSWKIGGRWHLTATVHSPQQFDIPAKFKFLLASGVEQASSIRLTYNFQPWQAGAGLSYDLFKRGDVRWTASGSLLYARWSKYIDRQSARPEHFYAWSDTLTGALGARVQRGKLASGLDLQYKPTPVTAQTGRTNYVDNDRVGAAWVIEQGFALAGIELKVGAQLLAYRLLSRYQRKLATPISADGKNRTPQLVTDEVPDDALLGTKPVVGREGLQTNNPGWPGFLSRGWVTSAGIYLTVVL